MQGDRGTVLQHIRMSSGFRLVQRRGKNGTCDSNPSFADFADDCYADTLIEGRFGLAYDEVRPVPLHESMFGSTATYLCECHYLAAETSDAPKNTRGCACPRIAPGPIQRSQIWHNVPTYDKRLVR